MESARAGFPLTAPGPALLGSVPERTVKTRVFILIAKPHGVVDDLPTTSVWFAQEESP
jgi:hypothetical protein